jgi:hypothetical protein
LAGQDLLARAAQALAESEWVVVVLSPAYLASPYAGQAWLGALLQDPAHLERLLPVRIEPCDPPPQLAGVTLVDLYHLEESAARSSLRNSIARRGVHPPEHHRSPSSKPPRFPPHGPAVSNIPPRNPNFTGRRDLPRAALRQPDRRLVGCGRAKFGDAPERHDHGALSELRRRQRWLLVFDNAERAKDLEPYWPPGGGHVLVTSRDLAWIAEEGVIPLSSVDGGKLPFPTGGSLPSRTFPPYTEETCFVDGQAAVLKHVSSFPL